MRPVWGWKWPSVCAGLLLALGCHSIQSPPQELCEPCHHLPRCCRDHVHIFIINGLDPVNWANLTGLREYLIELGFNNTSYGQLHHSAHFAQEIRRIHAVDPEARFVVIGFSFGANSARHVANQMREHDISLDLLVYLGGNTLGNTPRDRPDNVARIVNILAVGAVWNGAMIDRAENVQVTDAFHFGSPTHPATIETLTRELAVIASQSNYVEVEDRAATDLQPASLPKEWEFLTPARSLQPLPEPGR